MKRRQKKVSLKPVSSVSKLWALINTISRPFLMARARKFACPVISVGNIVAGGVGKTEVVIWLANEFLKRGKRVTICSRGYASDWENRSAYARDYGDARELKFPDETLVTLLKCPGASVAVGRDRAAVLAKYWDELSPEIVILDDGHQHFSIHSDLKILVHDFSIDVPIYRDFESQFKRADALFSFSDIPKKWEKLGWHEVRYRAKGVKTAEDKLAPLPSSANAFCGIGNPERFLRFLEKAGVEVAKFIKFRDHESYSEALVKELSRLLESQKSDPLTCLVTLKDYVKLEPYAVWARDTLKLEIQWVDIELKFQTAESKAVAAIVERFA